MTKQAWLLLEALYGDSVAGRAPGPPAGSLKQAETEYAFTRPRRELWVGSDYSRVLLKGKAGVAYQVWQCYIFSFSQLDFNFTLLTKNSPWIPSQAMKELNSGSQRLMVHGLGEEECEDKVHG